MAQKIIITSNEPIVCPKCTHHFSLDQGITRQTIEGYAKEFDKVFEEQKKDLTAQLAAEAERKAKSQYSEKISILSEQVTEQKKAAEDAKASIAKVQADTKAKVLAEFEQEKKSLAEDLADKEEKIRQFRNQELDLLKRKKDLEEAQVNLELELQRKLDAERQKLVAEAERKAKSQYSEQISILSEQVTEQKKAAEDAKASIAKVQADAKTKAIAEFEQERKSLAGDLADKEEKIRQFREQELDLRKKQKNLEEARDNQKLEFQRQLDAERQKLGEEISHKEATRFALIEAEYKKKIEDAQKSNEDLRRKLEQGSQQLQGEVLELEMENILTDAFRHDRIEEVKKGVRGADVLQTVCTPSGQACGCIIWEAKRAENWSETWLQKLKDDQQAANAKIAVLVTTALPKGSIEPFFQRNGVWVVSSHLIRPVAEALRTLLLETHRVELINTGKEEKMELLYTYLTSENFSRKIRTVVDSFTAMKSQLDSEKRAIQTQWANREKQISRVTETMASFVGELQAIAQDGLPQLNNINQLELPSEEF